jgi:hypothetical protein
MRQAFLVRTALLSSIACKNGSGADWLTTGMSSKEAIEQMPASAVTVRTNS